MRLLDRYLLRELLVPFIYCLSGFLIFWISLDLFSELASFEQLKLKGLDVVRYYFIRTPEFLVLVVPIALLLALLYALTNHARHQELTAMRAAGVSLWRLALPYLAVGGLLSLGVLALNELWVPESSEAAEVILNFRQQSQTNANAGHWERRVGFTNAREKRMWFMAAYNLVTHEMIRPHVEWTLRTGTHWDISAERAWPNERGWVFTNVQELVYPASRGALPVITETNVMVLGFSETPEEIRSQIKINRINNLRDVKKAQLSIREILDYKRLHPEEGEKTTMLDTKLHGRLAWPVTCVVVVLIALPFGAAAGRRNVFVGVASSILICFIYLVLMQLGLALGTGGYVAPWIAAWAPNFLFAAAAIGLVHWA